MPSSSKSDQNTFVFKNKKFTNLSILEIKECVASSRKRSYGAYVYGVKFSTKKVEVTVSDYSCHPEPRVTVQVKDNDLLVSCTCEDNSPKGICKHSFTALTELKNDRLLQIPINDQVREEELQKKALSLGIHHLDTLAKLDDFFSISVVEGRIYVTPKVPILKLDSSEVKKLKSDIIPSFQLPTSLNSSDYKDILVMMNDDFSSGGYLFSLMTAPLAKNGKIKSPIQEASISEKIKNAKKPEEFIFYSSLLQLQSSIRTDNRNELYINIIRNPFQYETYFFSRSGWNDKITPAKLKPMQFKIVPGKAVILVDKMDSFYSLKLKLKIEDSLLGSKYIRIHSNCVEKDDTLFFIQNEQVIKIFNLFKKYKHNFCVTEDEFNKLKTELLDPLEQSVEIKYSFIQKASKKMIDNQSLDVVTEHIVYLSESEDYILFTPIIKYGTTEIPILSNRQLYVKDENGELVNIPRNETSELRFKRAIQAQHPDFEDNPNNNFYYLHKQYFLEKGWFIDAFETWKNYNYTVLGFKELKNIQRLNTNRIKVVTSVKSGIDWFDVHLKVQFGDQEIRLKDLQKSVFNKDRYVRLGDGTEGLLPEEWIEKFGKYFRSGKISDNTIRTHKSNFTLIDELFDQEGISEEVKMELEVYREKLANFHSIRNVKIPRKLNGQLRDYQKEGLNWLNFLDEFNFGGCLADDMGLGKTIQLIAYFLLQIEKGNKKPNLVVVPTSLLQNWAKEIEKFAPTLNYLVLYGNNRQTDTIKLNKYQVVITSYGTLLNDIEYLKKQTFNSIVLDESQAIKNPNSKRYKAVRLLQGRQHIVATGTPIENNTFDLFSQLSFAIPGLFGSQKNFAADYSTPIDQFQDTQRSKELMEKIKPFVLRRTKQKVAKELPEKTEITVYCEMGKEQRKIYDAYKKEFQAYLQEKEDDDIRKNGMHILQGLTKLRQICNSPGLLADSEGYGNDSAKLEELMQQIETIGPKQKILIFSQFVTMLDLIKARFDQEKIKYAYLTGQTRNRQEQVDLFQEDEDTRIFLISIKAGGSGLNLTKAEYVFIVDPWWNPAVENQAIDRAYRIGQENKVIAIRLITPDSIEEKIVELQGQKNKLAEDLIHTDSGFFKNLSKKDLLNIV